MAAAYASYAFTEVAAIFPITPSSPMAETVDEWSARGNKNLFGQKVKLMEMQSEAGAAGTVHGSLAAGALTTTYTASQGLLLMIPNMYKMAGELLPAVFHVSARALASHALSIFGDHQDVMAARQTGFAFLSSANVQEAMDLGFITHLAAIKSRVPFVHFFDGFRTSHELQKINVVDYDDIKPLVDFEAIKEFRKRSLNSDHPKIIGTAQNPDIYFQGVEMSNPFYEKVPDIIEHYMNEYGKVTGRTYKPFEYYGAEDAENIIIAMGSVLSTIEETIDYLNNKGEKVGVLKVHLYRPFSAKHFLNVLPNSVKRIAVLDRTKEAGSLGEPLYLDVTNIFYEQENKPLIVGGRYGLGSKDTTPSQIMAVYKNLKQEKPKNHFTIGIIDDVTHTSLPPEEEIKTSPESTISCKFWGLGSDGTVGANKSAIKIIGDNTDMYAQGYFQYDSKKSGGSTISHLRFGKEPIRSSYLVQHADYIACHNRSYVYQYDLLKGIKQNGIFVLNSPWTLEELEKELPAALKRSIAKNNVEFYNVDAIAIAQEIGLGKRINMIMQSAFFKLANVIPVEKAVEYLKQSIQEMYGKKGEKIVKMNQDAVDRGITDLKKIDVPASWANAQDEPLPEKDEPDFVKNIQRPMERHEGDDLPVSAFMDRPDGSFPMGTTKYEKRGIAVSIPEWQPDKCIQCNQCSYICPHAVIRPFLLDDQEKENAPDTFETLDAKGGKAIKGLQYRIQVSPLDCTGCANCADVCPAPGKALIMKEPDPQIEAEAENWEYAVTVSEKSELMNINTLKGSQFATPLFEFHGACPGCGETPYIKLVTQLYGDRMIIANATGCSSIYGGSAPSFPYSTNLQGKGPAWGNSLFEDNAEYGLGMYLAGKQMRERIEELMREAVNTDISDNLKEAFKQWLEGIDNAEVSKVATQKIYEALEENPHKENELVQQIMEKDDHLIKKSYWLIGGDGWAYDIGYGGLDHVLSTDADVNILVLDTQVYSNTGGQASKATPTAAVAKFAATGKRQDRKDLGKMAMSYEHVYVSSIAMGANMNQTIKAITEAESHKGPSLIIAYSTCISHGLKTGMGNSILQMKDVVQSGHWPLYRYDPRLKEQGKNPFMLDYKELKESLTGFMDSELRFTSLKNVYPELAGELSEDAVEYAEERFEGYKRLAEQDYSTEEEPS